MITRKEIELAAKGSTNADAFKEGVEWALKAADVAFKEAQIKELTALVAELREKNDRMSKQYEIYAQEVKDLKFELEGYSSDERDYI